MAYAEEIIAFKQQIASLIINNSEIIELLNEPTVTNSEDLIYNNIFNFLRVPSVPNETKTYICYKIDVPEVCPSNFLFKKLEITFWIISHQDIMITDLGGNRIDLISSKLEKMLIGYKDMGNKPLELISNIETVASNLHPCRIVIFKAEDLVKKRC